MKTLKIHENDNVEVMLDGDLRGHKRALRDIKCGGDVIKYGYPIGTAVCDIQKGGHVHTHNMKTKLDGVLEYKYEPIAVQTEKREPRTFMGYVRRDGSVGIRNEIWIINTVGCVNKTAELLAKKANELYTDGIDGVFTFSHPFGCSQLGDDMVNTQKTLAGLVRHPNAAGVLVLGLGCENNNIEVFKTVLGETDTQRVKFLNTQDCADEIAEGLKIIGELAEFAKTFKRQPCDISKLVIGLKCGGSDGLSGITANPLIGRLADRMTSMGASAVLTEVPEMFGAETILMNRCVDRETFDKTVSLINDFKEYFLSHGQPVGENPSPGNKKGGITTLEDKSLGCVQKSGTSSVTGVIGIGEYVTRCGLNLLTGPGNDITAVTNLTASGCHMIFFSTGRGTPVGAPVPTVKISTNTALYEKKPHWIDFDAGEILNGAILTDELFEYAVSVAEGTKTNNEKNGFREIAVFKDGVTL